MTYRVTVTRTAVKERKRLTPQEQKRIDAALKSLIETPRPFGVKKLSGRQQDWRIRVGSYRILYEIDDDN
jgi:mRNA interferase RelE/StbE